ncbi:DUF7260 family protein [Halobaculum limi]|uniref:DUF7260 family protein n=1 Tax=Halobaculum limi TaxID=3031916 RepID=UPI0024070A04|nr:hypothetical protein [Halobaculum sp. YSMS11]
MTGHRLLDPLNAAETRFCSEREAVVEKREAYETFRREVCQTPLDDFPAGRGGGSLGVVDGPIAVAGPSDAASTATSGVERVRERFAALIRSHSLADVEADEPLVETIEADEPLVETIEAEFDADVARALSQPNTRFTEAVRDHLLSRIRERCEELDAMEAVLDTEADSVAAAREVFENAVAVTDRVPNRNLLALEFDDLRERYDTLERVRERCEDALEARQSLLHGPAGGVATSDRTHRAVVRYLYGSLDEVFPVLHVGTALVTRCGHRSDAVADQIARRV